MVIKLNYGIECRVNKKDLESVGLTKDYIYFEDCYYGMYLRLHKSEIHLFIKYRPNSVLLDRRFKYSRSNHINKREHDVIIDYLIKNCIKRKYKTVLDLVSSKTRLVNKRKMLLEKYSTDELVDYIEDKKKGETVCQS